MADFWSVVQGSGLSATRKARLLDSYCAAHGYQAELIGPEGTPIPNPETKQQFFSRMVTDHIKNAAASVEGVAAGDAARDQKLAEIKAIPL